MKLIIVESPTKAKTISQFLGKDFKVESSFGHIRDLPASKLGIDTENDFKPTYIIPTKARKTMNALKKSAKDADSVILATDGDREGEAIAWHVAQVLELKNPQRIVFHEITKSAIQEALKNPREIDMNRVDAQQARRILDRLVGYKLSPFLWKKVARRLSAGRVQSVAVRLVVEREDEIRKFNPQEYWSIETLLAKQDDTQEFTALLTKKDDKPIDKLDIKSKKEADAIEKDLKGAAYQVTVIERKEVKRNPSPPFITSTLQQTAWQRFHFPARMTMQVAQRLYETGHITYHRTDSVSLSQLSLVGAKKYIAREYGNQYWPGFQRQFKTKSKRAQEAHEAIRPTHPDRTPDKVKLDKNQQRLYDIIWRRFMASQMSQAVFDATTIDVAAKNYTFRATGQILKFDGFLKVYPVNFQEEELPNLQKEDELDCKDLILTQHFTQPPARYNEASLIKALESHEIGRPSTYAPILSTIQERNYIEQDEQRRFKPTEIGEVVNNLLVEHFPEIVDINFTAEMEDDLDKIAEDKKEWVPMIKDFYDPFEKNLEKKYKEVSKQEIAQETTDKKCPECGEPLIIRLGKYGKFYACSTFPKCKHTESLEKNTLNIPCPKCQTGRLAPKRTKRKKIFYGCDRYPECDYALWDKPTGDKCETCDSLLVQKGKNIKCSNSDCKTNKK
ncbi:type I DNA topoisomerase [Patescibacteria group bacterium]|nr:type I DNA topoisomerase [Patescibacteria group bacterium]